MANIYSVASEVIVWLGPDVVYEGEAVRCIKYFKSYRTRSEQEDMALKFFFYAPLWSRLWVIQQLLLAQEVTILYGFSTVPWGNLLMYCKHSRRDQWNAECFPDKFNWFMDNARAMRSRWSSDRYRPFYIIDRFGLNKCVDARDKIYGFQALFDPEQRVVVDYNHFTSRGFANLFVVMALTPTNVGPNRLAPFFDHLRKNMGLEYRVEELHTLPQGTALVDGHKFDNAGEEHFYSLLLEYAYPYNTPVGAIYV